MDTILVISTEEALAQTLEDELTDVSVARALPGEASARMQDETLRLILADDEEGNLSPLLIGAKAPLLWLLRPARLSDLLYTIRQRLQGKISCEEHIPLAGSWRLLPGDRALSSVDSGMRIPLTEKEGELLLCLLEASGKAVARDAMLKRIWGYSDDVTTHTLETHIYRLRGKLSQMGEPIDIEFPEEGGYRLKLRN